MQVLAWTIQILILSVGIHLFLRFVRTTRGNRLIRGLFVAVIGGIVGLWGLSTAFGFEELEHLLQGATSVIVVTFAIVFQSELRRAIAQLGERSFVGRLMHTSGDDTVARVARAARALAKRKEGALVAFERESSLQTFAESGTRIDSEVRARLLESIFYHGTSLHDGAVIVRKDRLVAASCFFPLPEDADLDARYGTRHRAAVGLTEESDAVVLVVSEETGAVSIAHEGRIEAVQVDRIEGELRRYLEAKETRKRPQAKRRWPWSWTALRRDIGWFTGSVVLASGILYVAHRDIRMESEYQVTIQGIGPSERRSPQKGEILVQLPYDDFELTSPRPKESFKVVVDGSRAQVARVGGGLRGVIDVQEQDWDGGPIDLARVQWEERVLGLTYRWANRAPDLAIERYEERLIALRPETVIVDDSLLSPRFRVQYDRIHFDPDPTKIKLRGPASKLDGLTPDTPIQWEAVVLTERDRRDRREVIRLSTRLKAQGFTLQLESPIEVVVPVLPVQREAGTLQKEIALICLAPEQADQLSDWALPAHSQIARFTIETSGLIPVDADPASSIFLERFNAIRRYVEENLMVFVDIAELPPVGEGRSAPVRWTWRKNWRDSLQSLGIEEDTLGEREQLNVRLESESHILLERREDDTEPTGGERRYGE